MSLPMKPLSTAPAARILVVDDELIARESLSELLATFGHNVVDAVPDAATAEVRAKELRPDAILMDVLLPGASGIEAAQAIAYVLQAVARAGGAGGGPPESPPPPPQPANAEITKSSSSARNLLFMAASLNDEARAHCCGPIPST